MPAYIIFYWKKLIAIVIPKTRITICSMYQVFTYMQPINLNQNVGKYSSPMEHVGYVKLYITIST